MLDLGLEHGAQHVGLLEDGSLPALCRSRAVFTVHGHASRPKALQNIGRRTEQTMRLSGQPSRTIRGLMLIRRRDHLPARQGGRPATASAGDHPRPPGTRPAAGDAPCGTAWPRSSRRPGSCGRRRGSTQSTERCASALAFSAASRPGVRGLVRRPCDGPRTRSLIRCAPETGKRVSVIPCRMECPCAGSARTRVCDGE